MNAGSARYQECQKQHQLFFFLFHAGNAKVGHSIQSHDCWYVIANARGTAMHRDNSRSRCEKRAGAHTATFPVHRQNFRTKYCLESIRPYQRVHRTVICEIDRKAFTAMLCFWDDWEGGDSSAVPHSFCMLDFVLDVCKGAFGCCPYLPELSTVSYAPTGCSSKGDRKRKSHSLSDIDTEFDDAIRQHRSLFPSAGCMLPLRRHSIACPVARPCRSCVRNFSVACKPWVGCFDPIVLRVLVKFVAERGILFL
jgi:hypothetical protein